MELEQSVVVVTLEKVHKIRCRGLDTCVGVSRLRTKASRTHGLLASASLLSLRCGGMHGVRLGVWESTYFEWF